MTAPETTQEPIVSQLDDEDLVDLVELFVSELPDRIAALEEALVTDDPDAVARLAHQLKGAAGSYGFPTISDAAKIVEAEAKDGDTVDHLTQSISELGQMCRRACAASPAS